MTHATFYSRGTQLNYKIIPGASGCEYLIFPPGRFDAMMLSAPGLGLVITSVGKRQRVSAGERGSPVR
jgi:hypothetical protein